MAQPVLVAQEAVGAECLYTGLDADSVDVAAMFGDEGSELAFVRDGKRGQRRIVKNDFHSTALSLMSLVCVAYPGGGLRVFCCTRMAPGRTASSLIV